MVQISGIGAGVSNGQNISSTAQQRSASDQAGKVHWTQSRTVRAIAAGVGLLAVGAAVACIAVGFYAAAIAAGAVALVGGLATASYFYTHRHDVAVSPEARPEAGQASSASVGGGLISQKPLPTVSNTGQGTPAPETPQVRKKRAQDCQNQGNQQRASVLSSEQVKQQSKVSREELEDIHKAVDHARDQYAKGIQQTCIIDAIAAYKAIKKEPFDQIPGGVKGYFSTHGNHVQFDLTSHMLQHDQLDLDGGSEVKYTEAQQQLEQDNTAKFESERAKGVHQKNIQQDDEFSMKEHKCYTGVSGISKTLNENEIREIKSHIDKKFPDGCLVLKQANGNGGGTGHYSYYHPRFGFITGGSKNFKEGNSAYDFKRFIGDYNQTKNGTAYFYNAAKLCEG